jgi:hypothetical protein
MGDLQLAEKHQEKPKLFYLNDHSFFLLKV